MTNSVPLTHTPITKPDKSDVVLTDALMRDPVTVINSFTVPPENRELFLTRWKVGVAVMAAQPGFIEAKMHRSLDPNAEFGYVTVAQWESGEALAKARKNPDWLASVHRLMDDVGAGPRPMIYETALLVKPGEKP